MRCETRPWNLRRRGWRRRFFQYMNIRPHALVVLPTKLLALSICPQSIWFEKPLGLSICPQSTWFLENHLFSVYVNKLLGFIFPRKYVALVKRYQYV